MLLEKIKQHAGKFSFFGINILLIVIGALFMKQKALEKDLANSSNVNVDELSAQSVDPALDPIQNGIATDRQKKLESLAGNSGTVTQSQTVPVTKVVPVPSVPTTKKTRTT